MGGLTTAGTGLTISKCDRAHGGIKELYGIKRSSLSSISIGSSPRDIDNIVFASVGVGFEKITFRPGEAEYTQSQERQDNKIDINSIEIKWIVPAPVAADLQVLEEIRANCDMVWIVRNYNDDFFLAGYDEAIGDDAIVEFKSAIGGSGRVKTDDNIIEFTLMCEQEFLMLEVTELTGASASTPAAIAAELVAATTT